MYGNALKNDGMEPDRMDHELGSKLLKTGITVNFVVTSAWRAG